MVAVARSQAIADGLGALVHANDNSVVAQVHVQAGLQASKKVLQQLCKSEAIACATAAPLS